MREESLKKRCRNNRIIIVFTCGITIATLIAVVISTFNYYYKELKYNKISMDNLPVGSLQGVYESPDKEYILKSYICSKAESIDWAARCELVNNKNKEVKNIYWDYKIETMGIEWLDKDTVLINGHEIDVKKEVYDWRKEN